MALPRRIRTAMRRLAWTLLTPVLFRLCLGRWPAGPEAAQFRDGLLDGSTQLPPCCRAMLNVPAAHEQIGRVLLFDMVRTGIITPQNPLDIFGAKPSLAMVPPQSGNPLSFWRGPPISFLHLEKTAGVSLARVLTEQFHPQQIDTDPHRTLAPHLRRPFAGRPKAVIRRHALVFGHYDLPSLNALDPGRTVVTLLRNPADRILSLYYYWRSINLGVLEPSAANAGVRLAHRHGLLEFLSTDDPLVRDYIDNFYVRRLTGHYATGAAVDRLAGEPGACLAAALAGLRTVAFVGITERMQASVDGLAHHLGFLPPATAPRDNTAASNAAVGTGVFRDVEREPLTPAHHRQLTRLTRLDAVVYQAACDRFAKQSQQAGDAFGDCPASGVSRRRLTPR